MKISLIITVLNEARSLPALLDSIAAQTCRPDEVIICDGGSTDRTIDLLLSEQRFPIQIIERPGSNISQGRNAAIAEANGEVIVSTDAGVRLEPNWLEKLVEPLTVTLTMPVRQTTSASSAIQQRAVSAGFFLPDVRTPFEVAMGATVLPQLEDVQPEKFLPSSRSVAFTKAAWQTVGGYPEWLDYCEDLVFDFALLEKYRPFVFVPDAIAHFKPRGSLKSFFRQYYLYARGDGKANLWLKRHLIRYGTYLVGLPGIALLSVISPWCLLLYVIGAVLYLKRPYQRLFISLHRLDRSGRLQAIGWVPIVRVTGDIAKMLGYPVGVVWRIRHKRRI